MNKGIIAALAVAASVAIAAAALSAELPPEPDYSLGLVVNPPAQSVSLAQLRQAYSDAASAGIGRSNAYMFWSIVEPQKNQYDWRQYDLLLGASEQNGLKTTLFFSIVNGQTLGPFPDWMGSPQIGGISSDDLVSVIDAALTRYPSIDALIISGQTESFFRNGNIQEYSELFSAVYDGIKERHPDVRIGNSFALHHVLNKELGGVVESLAAGDFVAFSYWPVDSLNDIVKTPAEAGGDLAEALELAPGRVAFFEVGWSTSEFVGGDAESQKEFVGVFFDFYRSNEERIEFAVWFKQHDMEEGTCGQRNSDIGGRQVELTGSGLGGNEHVIERLDRFVCNAGLVNTDGTEKPGWAEFKRQVRN